jgi:hypothetical protein
MIGQDTSPYRVLKKPGGWGTGVVQEARGQLPPATAPPRKLPEEL